MLSSVATLSGHNETVWHCAWSPDGRTLATSGSDKSVRLWTQANGRWTSSGVLSSEQRRTIRSAAFSPCGRFLASTSFDATIVVWHHKDSEWTPIGTLEGHENEVKRAAWSPSGRFLASASRDKSVWLWEMDEDEEFSCCSVLQNHSQDVKHVAWHPRTDILFSCSYDNSWRSYAFDGDDWVESFAAEAAHSTTVWGLALDATGDALVTAAADGVLKIWEPRPAGASAEAVKSWESVATLGDWHPGPVYFVDWCPLTGAIASACEDNAVRIMTREPGAQPPTFALAHVERDAHSDDVNCVAWNPKLAGLLASASDDGLVKLWQLDTTLITPT